MSTKMRKRKKPTYLNDFVQNPEETEDLEPPDEMKTNKKLKRAADLDDLEKSGIEEKEQEEKEILVDSVEGQCSLCEERLDTGTGQEDIKNPTGSSDSSYATILNAVFNNSQHLPSDQAIPRLVFSSGQICRLCKDPIKHLDLLQNKVIGLKKVILTRASKKLEGISGKQKEEESIPEPEADVVDDGHLTNAKKKKRKKVSFENSHSASSDKSVRRRIEQTEVSSPESDCVQEEDVDDVTKVQKKRRPMPTAKKVSLKYQENSPSVSSDKSARPRSEQKELSSPNSDDKPVRPRREKPQNTMSDIEKAKIKNLKSEMKFSVKKRSQSDVYIIEYLKEKAGGKYLVKWENRHESENTWENKNKIPSSVLQVNLIMT